MTNTQRRRLALLERRAVPVIERVKIATKIADENFHREMKRCARIHARNFGAVLLYGNPQPDESLADAWVRCRQADIWPSDWQEKLNLLSPFDDLGASIISEGLYSHWGPTLPGETEKEKFDRIFANAPAWLVWLTFAEMSAEFLDYQLPDLSEVKNLQRSSEVFKAWPALSAGKFEFRQGPAEFIPLDVSTSDAEFFEEMRRVPPDRMTRLDRKKFLSVKERFVSYLKATGKFPSTQDSSNGDLS